jgi:hypothetical protein
MARIRENNFLMNYEDSGMGAVDMSAPTESRNPSQSIIDALKQQILAQGTSDKWKGGISADKAAEDMARIMAGIGITDINQFGPVTKEVDLYMGESPDGTPIYQKQTEQTFGNKETGQAVPVTYSERQTGNAFGGTFEGKGNTGYRVDFTPDGKPVFYTTGASSSNVGEIIKPFAQMALLGAGIGGLQNLAGGGSLFGGGGLFGGAAAPITTEAALAQANMALGGVGGSAGAAELASALATGAPTVATTALTGGSGLITGANAGITAESVAAKLAADAGAGGLLSSVASTVAPSVAPAVASAVTPAVAPAVASTAGGLLSSAIPGAGTIGGALASGALSSLGGALGGAVTGGLNNLISGGLGTAGNLLQMQQSKEAAQKAQAMIEAETAAAKQAAQFRPVGMTTRFGTSEFKVDPTTGQLVSAGYTLTPEAKAQQDRLVALQNQGLTQAEQAQAQFAPLQTGAQSLFNLGNQYLAQSPQDVAQNYLNQQLALLQPGRELELANLQNRLQQQGRSGLSVAQGGSYGATTPELQALYNARAMQEAQLAANAQQAGQQQVQFGAGLLGQGAQTMGQYYGGQQAAYAPYTTASGQVQGLEALGQQPLTMGIGLGQQAAQAGSNVGRLGLTGAQLSTNLATSADATRNLAAQGLIAAGNPNAMFGSALNKAIGGLFGTPKSGFSYGQYGTGVDPSTGEFFGSLYF